MRSWKFALGYEQHRENFYPCGCFIGYEGQECHFETPESTHGVIECHGCGATWDDWEGDEWQHGYVRR